MGFNVAIPVLTAAVLGLLVVGSLWQTAAVMERLRVLSQFSMRIAGLVLELQKERGLSAIFVSSNGQQLATELSHQRELSDTQIAAVQSMAQGMALKDYSHELRVVIESGVGGLAEVTAARADITARRLDGPATLAFLHRRHWPAAFGATRSREVVRQRGGHRRSDQLLQLPLCQGAGGPGTRQWRGGVREREIHGIRASCIFGHPCR
jgi:hypothetical protein